MRFRLVVEYDGTDYQGWQIQPEERTVQGVVEAALQRLLGDRVRVAAAAVRKTPAQSKSASNRSQARRTPPDWALERDAPMQVRWERMKRGGTSNPQSQ